MAKVQHVVEIAGSSSTLLVSQEQWKQHGAVIVAFADGSEIEHSRDSPKAAFGWTLCGAPTWRLDCNYRVKEPSPKPGEVWNLSGAPYLFTVMGWIKVEVHNWEPFKCSMHKEADTLEEFINGNS